MFWDWESFWNGSIMSVFLGGRHVEKATLFLGDSREGIDSTLLCEGFEIEGFQCGTVVVCGYDHDGASAWYVDGFPQAAGDQDAAADALEVCAFEEGSS